MIIIYSSINIYEHVQLRSNSQKMYIYKYKQIYV